MVYYAARSKSHSKPAGGLMYISCNGSKPVETLLYCFRLFKHKKDKINKVQRAPNRRSFGDNQAYTEILQ